SANVRIATSETLWYKETKLNAISEETTSGTGARNRPRHTAHNQITRPPKNIACARTLTAGARCHNWNKITWILFTWKGSAPSVNPYGLPTPNQCSKFNR